MPAATTLWRWTRAAHRSGHPRLARLLKAVNFQLNHALLPGEAEVGQDVRLGHHGHGVIIHPNSTIGDGVDIWHGVTIAAQTTPGSAWRVYVGPGVVLGANVILVGPGDGDLHIGRDARIGAGVTVTRDVPADHTVVPAQPRMFASSRERDRSLRRPPPR